MARASAVSLTTVTPVYQGEAYLRELVTELAVVKARWEAEKLPVELVEAVFVDDGSIDDSARVLDELRAEFPWVTVVTLAKNFGQHAATVAGILHTSADWVVTLDEDLQHRPEFILDLLLHAVLRRLDTVYARPDRPVHRSRFRNISSRAIKGLMSIVARNPNITLFNSYRIIRGSIARAAASVSSHDAYFDMSLFSFTDRMGSLTIPLSDRRALVGDRSGYDWRALLAHARRLMISSEANYLRLGALIGLLTMVFAAIMGIFKFVQTLLYPETIAVRGWSSLFVSIMFFGGLTAFLIGALFEYLSIIYFQAQGKPAFYVVDRTKDEILRPLAEERGRK